MFNFEFFFSQRTRDEIRQDLEDLVKSMIDEFYQPDKNNFTARFT